jgi:hypothetical protein
MNNLLDDNRMAVTRIDLKGAFEESSMQFPLAAVAAESVRQEENRAGSKKKKLNMFEILNQPIYLKDS